MAAFFLIVIAIASRLLPHAGWFNFTAVGGSLLYFGARRPMRQVLWALLPLMAVDYYLTVFSYRMAFHAQDYVITWVWYLAAIVLGSLLLREHTSVLRVVSAALLSATSFFAVSNYAVWAGSGMYPHSFAGLTTCYAAAVPFYRNDVISTLLVAGVAFGIEAAVRHARGEDSSATARIAA